MTDIEQLAKVLADYVMPAVPLDRQLWSPRQVAQYLDVSPRQVTERLSNRPGFPPAKRLPSDSGRGHLRWRAKDIIEWADKL